VAAAHCSPAALLALMWTCMVTSNTPCSSLDSPRCSTRCSEVVLVARQHHSAQYPPVQALSVCGPALKRWLSAAVTPRCFDRSEKQASAVAHHDAMIIASRMLYRSFIFWHPGEPHEFMASPIHRLHVMFLHAAAV